MATCRAQSFAILIIVFAGDSRTSLRQPPVSDRLFKRTTLAISYRYTVGEEGEATKRATAAAEVCGSREPRAALQSSILTTKSCVSQRFSMIPSVATFQSDSVPASCQLATFRYALCRSSAMVQARSGFGVPAGRFNSKDLTRQLRWRPPPSPQTRTSGRALKPDL